MPIAIDEDTIRQMFSPSRNYRTYANDAIDTLLMSGGYPVSYDELTKIWVHDDMDGVDPYDICYIDSIEPWQPCYTDETVGDITELL